MTGFLSKLRRRLPRPVLALAAGFALTACAWGILYLNPPGQKPPAGMAAEIGMKRFLPADSPRTFPQAVFRDADGAEQRLESLRGQVVLVNLWASWCPPCKEEMPTLARLQSLHGGADFQVVTVAVENAEAAGLQAALAQLGAANLPPYGDPDRRLFAALGARGLPTSVLLDRRGVEIGRLSGPAKWDSPPALRLIEAARKQERS